MASKIGVSAAQGQWVRREPAGDQETVEDSSTGSQTRARGARLHRACAVDELLRVPAAGGEDQRRESPRPRRSRQDRRGSRRCRRRDARRRPRRGGLRTALPRRSAASLWQSVHRARAARRRRCRRRETRRRHRSRRLSCAAGERRRTELFRAAGIRACRHRLPSAIAAPPSSRRSSDRSSRPQTP